MPEFIFKHEEESPIIKLMMNAVAAPVNTETALPAPTTVITTDIMPPNMAEAMICGSLTGE